MDQRDHKRPHQEQDQNQEHEQRRLYLILDDNPYGYSIREISLLSPPSSSSRRRRSSSTTVASVQAAGTDAVPVQCLPDPIISLESERGLPTHFAAVGTKILFTQCLNNSYFILSELDKPYSYEGYRLLMPVIDVRTRCVTFGPGNSAYPILTHFPLSAGAGAGDDELFVLEFGSFSKLSFNNSHRRQPPPPGNDTAAPWSWHQLPSPPFNTSLVDLTSYAVDADGQSFVFSADSFFCPYTDDPYTDETPPPATFVFHTRTSVWERRGDWALPFAGRAFFVRCLGAFVGLSKDPATSGHLVSCVAAAATGGPPDAWKLGKEKMFSDDPAETHVSATLVYTGSGGGGGSEFCLVQCVSVKHGSNGNNNSADQNNKNLDEEEEPRRPGYRYRLTSFSVSYDSNGDLTTGQTCRVQCYEVPRDTTQSFIDGGGPVTFWL